MKNRSFFSGILLLVLTGCVATDDYDFDSLEGISLSPRYAFPLLKGELGIQNLLNESDSLNLSIREDDVMYFHYDEEFESGDVFADIDIPDITFHEEVSLPSGTIPANTGMELPEMGFQGSVDEQQQQFKTIHYKGGELQYNLSSSIDIPLEISFSFPSITKEGQPLSKTINLTAGSPDNGTIPLADYLADLTSGGEGYNSIELQMQVKILPSDTQIVIPPGASLNAEFGLVDQEFKYIDGFLGQLQLELSTMSLEVGPFDDIFEDVDLADMVIDMQVENSYGVPMSLSFSEFVASNAAGTEVQVRTNPADEIEIAYPENPGEEGRTNIQIVNGSEVFNARPDEIRYTAEILINKDLENANNFITDEGNLKFKIAADVPLIGSFRAIEVQDTVDVDFKSDFEEFNVKDLVLKTKLVNEFPFAGDFQVYLLDDQFQVMDSLLLDSQKDVIVSSSVTPEGDLLAPGVYEQEIQIAEEKLDLLSEASHLIIQATLHTNPGENNEYSPVKFKSGYRLGVDLDILAELETIIEL